MAGVDRRSRRWGDGLGPWIIGLILVGSLAVYLLWQIYKQNERIIEFTSGQAEHNRWMRMWLEGTERLNQSQGRSKE